MRSDGLSRDAAALVLANPHLVADLLEALSHEDEAIRGHAADAIERVSRSRPDLLLPHLPDLVVMATRDSVPMVRWHLAMLLTNLTLTEPIADTTCPVLCALLDDRNAFVRSWAVSGLCLLARKYPEYKEEVLARFAALQQDPKIAVRHRAEMAVRLLLDDRMAVPAGWVKNEG